MTIKGFFNPEGKHIGLFFFKFILFSILGWGLWIGIQIPYNLILNRTAKSISQGLPLIETKFSPDRGTFQAMFAPYSDGPVKPLKKKPVAIKVLFNTLHFNIIPFFSLLLASPLTSRKRLIIFLIVGSLFLSLSHVVHLYLDIHTEYFRVQNDRGYFSIRNKQLPRQQYKEYLKWVWKIRLIQALQSFMEQVGSMVVPALIWLIYASPWILASLYRIQDQKNQA